MSAKQRTEISKLVAKYARVFDIPIESVTYELYENGDGEVTAPGLPRWSLGMKEEK